MVTTTASRAAPASSSVAAEAASRRDGPAAPAAVRRPAGGAETGPAQPSPADQARERRPPLDYPLIQPPNYEEAIVGGVAPSPIVATLLLLGLVIVLVSAGLSVAGYDVADWWIIGAMLAIIAFFMAAFVSRGG